MFFPDCQCSFISRCGIQFTLQAFQCQHWENLTKKRHEEEVKDNSKKKKKNKRTADIKSKKTKCRVYGEEWQESYY